MKPLRAVPRALLICLLLPAASLAQSVLGPPSARTGLLLPDDITRALIQQSSGDLAHDVVQRLALWDRSQVTPGYAEAAEWMAEKALECGLENVQVERFPSGEGVQYFGNDTERLWQVEKGELWLTSPFEVRLTTFHELPMSLARNSVTVNVEADVVDIGQGITEEDYPEEVRGKIVLTDNIPQSVWSQAVANRGAAGIVSAYSVPSFDMLNRLPGDRPDQVGWGGIPEPEPGETSPPAFLISSRRAQELRSLLQMGANLSMRMVVEASLTAGTLDVVNAVIPGSEHPEEEIIVTAHLDHYKPGANDNASGSAAALEIARTMNALIASGTLPRPLRTIRFLWVPEYMGTWAWLSRHQSDPVTRVANLNFDMVGENLTLTNARFSVGYTPDSNPSWLNAVMESIVVFMNRYNDDRYPRDKEFHIISVNGSRNRLRATMEPATVGTDHELFNNLKVPATGPFGWPDDNYHSSQDTPDKTDPTQLHRVAVLGLSALVTIAYADDAAALLLARQALDYGRVRIATEELKTTQIVEGSTPETFEASARRARAIVRHVYGRERAAVLSAAFFARSRSTRDVVGAVADPLADEEERAVQRIEDRIAARAVEMGVAVPSSSLSEEAQALARITPERVEGKELVSTIAAVTPLAADTTLPVGSVMQSLMAARQTLWQEGMPDLRLMGFLDALPYYADGVRNLQEIRDAYMAEYTELPPEAVEGLFRILERAGVMVLHER